MILEEIYKQNLNIEHKFKYKKILFIGSESYDAATITIIEGLYKLGFEILVYKKLNINSWFCETIISNLENIEDQIDFVLSNLHWGTRWSLYTKLNHKVPYILINGDDRIHGNDISSWRDMYNIYIKKYKLNPPDNIKNKTLSPYRWMEEIGNYNPDKIFMSQKYKINSDTIYLPFGIHHMYLNNNKKLDRKYDITHIPGPGEQRFIMQNLIHKIKENNRNLNIINEKVYGDKIFDSNISFYGLQDNNIHSWHRWSANQKYFYILNQSKILIYPGVDKDNAPGWDSKRPWEALSCGCILLMQQPNNFDNKEYPLYEINKNLKFEYQNFEELLEKSNRLLSNNNLMEKERQVIYNNAIKYFTSEPITRYFLNKILVS
jgi:hypothetical protein